MLKIKRRVIKKNKESAPRYKLIEDREGQNAKMGDLVVVHLFFANTKDTFDTYKKGEPVSILLTPSFVGSVEEGLTHASKGDSISILVSNDSLYTKLFQSPLPDEIKKGSFTTFYIRVVNIVSKEQLEKEEAFRREKKTNDDIALMEEMKQQILDSTKAKFIVDEEKIKRYLKENKLTAKRTPSGVYYIIIREGVGEQPNIGDSVSLHYVGKFLDGKMFDQSKMGSPLVFQVAVGAVIPGFDEGIMQLKKGAKATIIIPSPFAYGEGGVKSGENDYIIPPDSPLVFDVEMLQVNKERNK